jgi:hypothetical protein
MREEGRGGWGVGKTAKRMECLVWKGERYVKERKKEEKTYREGSIPQVPI